MEEVRRVAAACGLPSFRYVSFPPVSFAPTLAALPEAKLLPVAESAGIATPADPVLQLQEVALAAAYPMLAEVAETVAETKRAAANLRPPTATEDGLPLPSRLARRQPRPAGRTVRAAIGQKFGQR